ncbi:hypothetical protein FQA39_LY08433 [Lamprigera yunnana]|nr:hypothetical protein FQA39_LY08433 [Lamprigera yunnana]
MENKENEDSNNIDCSASESEEDNDELNIRQIQKLLLYKEIQRRKDLEKIPLVYRKQLKETLRMLKKSSKDKYKTLSDAEKKIINLKNSCGHGKIIVDSFDESESAWFSPLYLQKSIKNCILSRDWNNLTYFLLMLLKHKRFVAFTKQITLLKFMADPGDHDNIFLNEFLNLFKIDV